MQDNMKEGPSMVPFKGSSSGRSTALRQPSHKQGRPYSPLQHRYQSTHTATLPQGCPEHALTVTLRNRDYHRVNTKSYNPTSRSNNVHQSHTGEKCPEGGRRESFSQGLAHRIHNT